MCVSDVFVLKNFTFSRVIVNTLSFDDCPIYHIEHDAFTGLKGLTWLHIRQSNLKIIDGIHTLNVTGVMLTNEYYSQVNVEGSKFLKSMPNLQIVEITNMNLGSLIHDMKMSSTLLKLHLVNVGLYEHPKYVMDRWSNVTSLSLEGNTLGLIKKCTFYGMSSLKELYLTNTSLRYIEAGAFKGLLKLTLLHLNYNPLPTLDQEIFSDLRFDTSADHPGLKIHVAHLELVCDCNYKWLATLIAKESVKIEYKPLRCLNFDDSLSALLPDILKLPNCSSDHKDRTYTDSGIGKFNTLHC